MIYLKKKNYNIFKKTTNDNILKKKHKWLYIQKNDINDNIFLKKT